MFTFQYNLPVNLVFGRGKADLIGERTAAYGTKALLVTGGGSTKRSGLLDRVQQQLRRQGIAHILFDRVTPNPLTTTVYAGAELAIRESCDVVLALGGGSSLDAAKAIAFQAANGGDINDYIFARKTSDRALPVVAVPTTCGTGSEGNGFAVMTNPDTLDKKSLRCNAILPKCSIIDPLLMATMPRATLASVGFDALCHNTDGYLSRIAQPLTDLMALRGAELAVSGLRRVTADAADLDGWDELCLASTLGGMVIHSAGVTALHGMEHPVSGLRDAIHGQGLAALAPVVYEASIAGAPMKFAALARLLGGADEKDFVPRLRQLLDQLQLSLTLGQLGIGAADIDWLAENCLKVSAASMANHPVAFDLPVIKRLYLAALS